MNQELVTSAHPSLTEYVIELLRKEGIYTVGDLLVRSGETVAFLANISTDEMHNLRIILFEKYCPLRTTCATFYGKKSVIEPFLMGIPSLDEILYSADNQKCGALYEVIGDIAVGKTRFCYSIALNIAINFNYETIFIDTCNQFSGNAVHQMLKARGLNDTKISEVMHSIGVNKIFSFDEIFPILHKVLDNRSALPNLRLIVVDSVAALWYPLQNDHTAQVSSLIEQLMGVVRKMCRHYPLSIMFVNMLQTKREPMEHECADSDSQKCGESTSITQNSSNAEPDELVTDVHDESIDLKWESMHDYRLVISKIDKNPNTRCIQILQSSYFKEDWSCSLVINDRGFESITAE